MKRFIKYERLTTFSKLVTIIFFLGILEPLKAQEGLNGYLTMAAENNPGLKAVFSEYMGALENVPQVGALPDPQLAFGYFIQPVETRNGPMNFKISATQMFPWFGTLGARKDAATAEAKAQYEQFEEEKSKLFQEVKSNWYNLYFNSKATSITKENIQILNTFRQITMAKLEAGSISAVDQYRIEMEINDLENQLAYLNDKQHYLQVSFENLIGVSDKLNILIPDTLIANDRYFSKEAVMDSIKLQNHQLLALDLKMTALDQQKTAAKRVGRPNISVGIDYTFVGKGDNNMSGKDAIMFPMVGISIPLYRNKYKSMVQEVVYKQAANEFKVDNTRNVLENLMEKSWNELTDANRRIELYNTQSDLAHRALRLIETQYANSTINFEEVLRMERKLLQYRLELEKATTDKMATLAFIDYLMGK